jgi:hypothetical protein
MRRLYTASLILVLALTAGAALAKSKGRLYRDWSKASSGTYSQPAADLGKPVDQETPWSATTVSSAIDKPLEGKPISVVGEIVDLSCYLQVGKHGDKHRDCGQKCARNGQPIGLVAQCGQLFMLVDEEHNPRRDGLTAFRQTCIDRMAHIVRVHGTLSTVRDQKAIFVQGYVK